MERLTPEQLKILGRARLMQDVGTIVEQRRIHRLLTGRTQEVPALEQSRTEQPHGSEPFLQGYKVSPQPPRLRLKGGFVLAG